MSEKIEQAWVLRMRVCAKSKRAGVMSELVRALFGQACLNSEKAGTKSERACVKSERASAKSEWAEVLR